MEGARDVAPCPGAERFFVGSIHDGNGIPGEFLSPRAERAEELSRTYAAARDWGATLLAGKIAARLHVPQVFRVDLARLVLDVDRLPSAQRWGEGWLEPSQVRHLMSEHYDEVVGAVGAACANATLELSVHTSDVHALDGRVRPPVTLRSRVDATPGSTGYDPLLPEALFASTADPRLRGRLVLGLAEAGFDVTENLPRPLAAHSLDIRVLASRWFTGLERAFDLAHPSSIRNERAWRMVWEMLEDVHQRICCPLRGHVHLLQRAPEGREVQFEAARILYADLARFAASVQEDLLHEATRGADHLDALAVVVRKDLIWNSVEGPFGAPRMDVIHALARAIASAIRGHQEQVRVPEATLSAR